MYITTSPHFPPTHPSSDGRRCCSRGQPRRLAFDRTMASRLGHPPIPYLFATTFLPLIGTNLVPLYSLWIQDHTLVVFSKCQRRMELVQRSREEQMPIDFGRPLEVSRQRWSGGSVESRKSLEILMPDDSLVIVTRSFITKDDFEEMISFGLNSVRIPIGPSRNRFRP